MPTLSAALIVKDEEAVVGRILSDALTFCDEVVVADTGSTDRTVEIARGLGAKVVDFPWVDDFSAARNASFDACTSDWIIWLDADDRVTPEVAGRLAAYKTSLLGPGLDAVFLPYRYHFSEDGSVCTYQFPRERILRRGAGLRWTEPVHEVISVPDPARAVSLTDVWVEHRPLPEARAKKSGRNLRILEAWVSNGNRSLRSLFYLGNELADNGRKQEALASWADFVQDAPRGWERYTALTSMARVHLELGNREEGLLLGHRAIREDPTRAEAFVLVGRVHYDAQEWAAAVPYLLAATGCRPPGQGFVQAADYAYVPWDVLSICWHKLGDQRRALEALANAVEGNADRERLADNAGWMVRQW